MRDEDTMVPILEVQRQDLDGLCRRYGVRRLDLFGSATRDDFDQSKSDLDFLVEFEACSPKDHFERYFGLLESLRALFARRVDLVEAKAMRNPYFIRRVNQTRTPIFGA